MRYPCLGKIISEFRRFIYLSTWSDVLATEQLFSSWKILGWLSRKPQSFGKLILWISLYVAPPGPSLSMPYCRDVGGGSRWKAPRTLACRWKAPSLKPKLTKLFTGGFLSGGFSPVTVRGEGLNFSKKKKFRCFALRRTFSSFALFLWILLLFKWIAMIGGCLRCQVIANVRLRAPHCLGGIPGANKDGGVLLYPDRLTDYRGNPKVSVSLSCE